MHRQLYSGTDEGVNTNELSCTKTFRILVTTFFFSQKFLVIQFAEQSTAELNNNGASRDLPKKTENWSRFLLLLEISKTRCIHIHVLVTISVEKTERKTVCGNFVSLLGLFLHTSQKLWSCQDVTSFFNWSSILHYDVMTC